MKHLKKFENIDDVEYTVILFSNGKKYVNVNQPFPIRAYRSDFKDISLIVDINKIQKYSLNDAESCVSDLVEYYKIYNVLLYKFKVQTIEETLEEIQILRNTKKYNL